ncbi:MAG TPA: septal ring lytic transglycosylase RlpA family protein [Stellaceae bacterium]|nr:septal ring lytic transglycosylase RlpA family protein [Stellaceae bacterium]
MTFVSRLRIAAALTAAALLAACSFGSSEPISTGAAPGLGLGIYKVGKPYQVDGVWYYPRVDLSYDETGIASWYGEAFHGKYTANGEVFDLNGLTAAHHTLPMPSIVEVTNLETGRSIQLRVNDRGPFAHGRIIDVSRRAAQLLGFEQKGTAKVHVRVLTAETLQAQAIARRNGEEAPGPVELVQAAPRTPVDSENLKPLPGSLASANQGASRPVQLAAAPPAPAQMAEPQLTEKVTVGPARPNAQIYIQAGAFAQAGNAQRVKQRIDGLGSVQITSVRVNGASLFRVRLGPVVSVEEADRLLAKVLATGFSDARIVVD